MTKSGNVWGRYVFYLICEFFYKFFHICSFHSYFVVIFFVFKVPCLGENMKIDSKDD